MTGFESKRGAAADKMQEPVPLYVSKPALEGWRGFASDYERGFIDGMQKQAQSSVDKAVNQMAQPTQEPVAFLDWYENAIWGNEDFQDGCHRAWDAALEHTPPQREWAGLTEQERNDCLVQADPCECLADTEAHQLMVEVEAKLRERNS